MIGATLDDVETPALVIDLAALEHNIRVIAEHYRGKRIRLRPHGKNHKCPEILAMQIAAGATVGGVCCAKASEAEAFAQGGGVSNVLIANQVIDAGKIRRLAALARRIDVTVAIDDAIQLPPLSAGAQALDVTLGVIIEIDAMMRRGGVRDVDGAVALAKAAHTAPGLRFRGVMSHQVPRAPMPDKAQRFREGGGYIDVVLAAKRAIEAQGIPVERVSTGETWTYDVAAEKPEVTEIQGGTYIVMEVPYSYMREFRHAAKVMGRVVARPDAHTAIGDVPIDAIGAPNGPPSLDGVDGIAVQGIDHFGVRLGSHGPMPLAIGERFFLLTHQQDITMNRWDRYLGVRDGRVATVFEATARGCVH